MQPYRTGISAGSGFKLDARCQHQKQRDAECAVAEFEAGGRIVQSVHCILAYFSSAKLLQKSEMRKDIVIELSYKGFG